MGLHFKALVLMLFCFKCTIQVSAQQKDTAYFMQQYKLATKYHLANKVDSAISFYQKAIKWSEQNRFFDTSKSVSDMYSGIGRMYRLKEMPQESQEFLMKAIANARKYNHFVELRLAHLRLTVLHKTIAEKNWPFNYPTVKETETSEVYFSIKSVKPLGNDSLEVVANAGKLDGITNDSQLVRVSSRIILKDTLYHKSVSTKLSAPIYKLTDNFITIHISNEYKEKILSEDFIVCYTQTPVMWNKLFLKQTLLDNVIFKTNTDDYYGYRYYYYYANELVEQEALKSMLEDAYEAARIVGKDTLTNSDRAAKFPGGIFSNENMFTAILISKPIHLKLFVEYIQSVPADFMGNHPSFVTEYAKWVATESRLNPISIKPYLISIANKQERLSNAFNLFNQIKKAELIDSWLGDAMQNINDENFTSAKQNAMLIDEVVTINKDTANFGWSQYIFASIERKIGDSVLANKYLQEAFLTFSNTNNYEGKKWAAATSQSWAAAKSIKIGAQDGHTKNYITAISPNGKYFATGGADYQIKIWDKILGKEITTIYGHVGRITSLTYSSNGKYIVSAGEDKKLYVWNAYNYTLLVAYNTDGAVNVAKFSPDNKLLYVAEDSILSILNPFSDTTALVKKIQLHNGVINDFVFYRNDANAIYSCGGDGMVYKWNLKSDTKTSTFNKTFGVVKRIIVSDDGKFLSTISSDSMLTIFNIFLGQKVFKERAYLEADYYSNPFPAMYAIHSFSPNGKYLSYPKTADSFRIVNLVDFYTRKYASKLNYPIRSLLYTPDDNDLMLISSDYNIKLYYIKDYDFETNPYFESRLINFYSNEINRLQYTTNGNELRYLQFGQKYGRIDLATGKNYMGNASKSYFPNGRLMSLTGDSLYLISVDDSLVLLSSNTFNYTNRLYTDGYEKIDAFETTPNEDVFFISGQAGSIIGWDRKTNSRIFNTKIYTDSTTNSMYLYYDKHKNRLLTKATGNYILVIDATKGNIIDTIKVDKARYYVATAKNIYVTTADGYLHVFDATNFKSTWSWAINGGKYEALSITLLPDEQYAIIQNTIRSLALFDIINEKFVYNINDHEYGSKTLALSKDGKEFATGSLNGKINVYETLTGKLKATIHLPYKKDAFIVDTLNHYLATKNSLEAINVYYNDYVYPYDQFDLQLNRPDLVLAKLGRADSSLINNYYNAYKRRLKKLNLSEKSVNLSLHLPRVKLLNRYNIKSSTSAKDYTLDIECSDDKFNLQSVQVLVNNSPVLSVNGKNISSLKTNKYNLQVTLPLAKGLNKVKVFCTNINGTTSLKETFNVLSTFVDTFVTAKIYFVGIGVANYKDSSMNLTYSVKDIRDLASDFATNFSRKTLVVDTLLNQNVTLENIAKIKQRLLKTSPNDRVVVAVTGHGLLSDSLDFYYATYDVNFSKPEVRGLKYEFLEGLLNDVPAQEKIMFIDACHSGALDKDEILTIQKNKQTVVASKKEDAENVKGIATRSSIKIKNKTAKVSANSSYELMQNTFSDLSGSNGAIIVSAAGGMEYAFESREWNNGVFTYAIRNGLFQKEADKQLNGDKDGKVTIEELLAYVNALVTNLTNGRQKPNSRKENLEYNWIINY